jgi:hypothetical protein
VSYFLYICVTKGIKDTITAMGITIKNIRFHYKYRDAANYKAYGSVIFSNPNQLSLETIGKQLKEALIDQEYFIAQACKIPLIHSFPFDPELDHEWYELDYLEETNEAVTDERSIDAFVQDCFEKFQIEKDK